jgi:glycerol-3-phosphate acyltransferase PlsY
MGTQVGVVIAAYLLGSVPVGLIVGKLFFGKDIREQGSGNLGATNAYRALGPVAGVLVFVLDVGKGAVPVYVALRLWGPPTDPWSTLVLVTTGMAAIAGHNWPVYLKFKGGKGVSTAAGVLVVLFPYLTAVLAVVWIVTVLLTRYVSVGSIAIAVCFPILVGIFHGSNPVYVAFSVVAAAVVIFRHRSNIGRLLRGVEPRVLAGTSKEPSND